MDSETLVSEVLDDGKRFLEHLAHEGFEVTAALWLKASEDERWYFYIVSPLVDRDGLANAYRQLHTAVRALSQPGRIDPLEIHLIGQSNPIAKQALVIQSRLPGPSLHPVLWRGKQLGHVVIEHAYLYPMPVTTP